MAVPVKITAERATLAQGLWVPQVQANSIDIGICHDSANHKKRYIRY